MTLVIKNKITSDSIGFYIDFSNRRCFAPNLLNYSTWTPGSGSIIPDSTKYGTTNFSVVSSDNNENIRVRNGNPLVATKIGILKLDVTQTNGTNLTISLQAVKFVPDI